MRLAIAAHEHARPTWQIQSGAIEAISSRGCSNCSLLQKLGQCSRLCTVSTTSRPANKLGLLATVTGA